MGYDCDKTSPGMVPLFTCPMWKRSTLNCDLHEMVAQLYLRSFDLNTRCMNCTRELPTSRVFGRQSQAVLLMCTCTLLVIKQKADSGTVRLNT